MEAIISIISFVVLLALGWFVGGHRERRHFRQLEERWQAVSDMRISQLKSFPSMRSDATPPQMYIGEAVIASDYLKSFLAGLRNIFGGEVRSYTTLLERARSEAILRVVEQAREAGYNAVCNIRLESADIGGNATVRRMPLASIVASGTAYMADER